MGGARSDRARLPFPFPPLLGDDRKRAGCRRVIRRRAAHRRDRGSVFPPSPWPGGEAERMSGERSSSSSEPAELQVAPDLRGLAGPERLGPAGPPHPAHALLRLRLLPRPGLLQQVRAYVCVPGRWTAAGQSVRRSGGPAALAPSDKALAGREERRNGGPTMDADTSFRSLMALETRPPGSSGDRQSQPRALPATVVPAEPPPRVYGGLGLPPSPGGFTGTHRRGAGPRRPRPRPPGAAPPGGAAGPPGAAPCGARGGQPGAAPARVRTCRGSPSRVRTCRGPPSSSCLLLENVAEQDKARSAGWRRGFCRLS